MNATFVTQSARRWAELAARVGYTAKGIGYIVLGGVALRAALGWGGRATDTRGALQTMGRQQLFGDVLLALVAVGLGAYVFWRLAQSLLDLDVYHRGALSPDRLTPTRGRSTTSPARLSSSDCR